MTLSIYNLILHPTYYNKGFFNLGVNVDKLIRPENGEITLFLGEERREINGRVDRKANKNGTPRVHGRKRLSSWFKENFQLMDIIDVVILSPEQLWLRKQVKDGDTPLVDIPVSADQNISTNTNEFTNYQRIGSISNTQVGNDFEQLARSYFASQGFNLTRNYAVSIGVGVNKKGHKFDLGCDDPKIIVECKSHKWTKGDNVPSAKMTVWNEVMFYFFLASGEYRKILFVLKSYSPKRRKTLAEYYVQTYGHLIPPDVEIMEYDPQTQRVVLVKV